MLLVAASLSATPLFEISREVDNPYTGFYQKWVDRMDPAGATQSLLALDAYTSGYASFGLLEAWARSEDPNGTSGRTQVELSMVVSVLEAGYMDLPFAMVSSSVLSNSAEDSFLQAMVGFLVEVRGISSGESHSLIAEATNFEEWVGGYLPGPYQEFVVVQSGIAVRDPIIQYPTGVEGTLRIPLAAGDNRLSFLLSADPLCVAADRVSTGCVVEAGGSVSLSFGAVVLESLDGDLLVATGLPLGGEVSPRDFQPVSEPGSGWMLSAPLLWLLFHSRKQWKRHTATQ
jgi:hypothetical protein